MEYKNVKKEVICDKILNSEINLEGLAIAMTPNEKVFATAGQ